MSLFIGHRRNVYRSIAVLAAERYSSWAACYHNEVLGTTDRNLQGRTGSLPKTYVALASPS